MVPAYGVTGDLVATSSYGGTRLFMAMLLTFLMGGPTSQFMIPLFLNAARALPPFTGFVHGADGKPVWTNEKLPLAPGFPANPALVYPGLEIASGGGTNRQDHAEPPTWAPSPEYRLP